MSRPRLSLARTPRKPTLAMAKKAIRLFKGRGVPREVYRRNAISWLRAVAQLGDRHILKGGAAKWGQPGEPRVLQVFAPRRMEGSR